jgi:ubiquinone/menaquinone biosynthesis C-methylase UbiE
MSKASNHVGLNAKEWDSRAETYDEKRFDYFRYMQKRLIALLPLEENLCILDIGCGTG